MEKGPKIGLDKVYVASLTADNGTDAPTWGTPVLLAGAAKMSGNPNGKLVTDWGDNGPFFVDSSRGNLQATLELIDIDPAVLAAVLGQTRANGIIEENALDQAPYYALGFRVWIGGKEGSDKIYEYFWYPKGKFALPEQGAETKKDSITPQHTTLTAEFVKLAYNDVMSVHARSNGSGIGATTITNWFNQPVYSSGVDLTAVTVASVAGDASDHEVVITFGKDGESFSIEDDLGANDIILLVASTGARIAGTTLYAASAAGVAPTLTLTNSNLAAVDYVITVSDRVVDNNGVHVTPFEDLFTVQA